MQQLRGIMIYMVKFCTSCKITKALAEFYKNRATPDGYTYQCIPCDKEKKRSYEARMKARTELPSLTEKPCSTCKRVLPVSNFFKNASKKSGYSSLCKQCNPKEKRTVFRRKHPLDNRLRKYGLSQTRYEQMVIEQGGRCAICKGVPTHPLQVDHCHRTGKIRELLCSGCNAGIGRLGDDLIRVQKAVEYLSRHS
jgi:hypothetical protein